MLLKAPARKLLLIQFQMMLINSWWVLSFALFCFCAHLAAVYSHNLMLKRLKDLKDLRSAERDHWAHQHRLWSLRLANCHNLAWLELILMQELGVSPKKSIKAVFKEPKYLQKSTAVPVIS